MYDLVAGSKTVKSSYLLSKKNALELFPMLRGDKLCGAIVYYDGKNRYRMGFHHNRIYLTDIDFQVSKTTPE